MEWEVENFQVFRGGKGKKVMQQSSHHIPSPHPHIHTFTPHPITSHPHTISSHHPYQRDRTWGYDGGDVKVKLR